MERIDLNKYIETEKSKLKAFAKDKNLDNKIKLGIIGATRVKNNEPLNSIIEDFKQLGWETAIYKDNKYSDAIARAVIYRCTGIIKQDISANEYIIPRFLDCGGSRPDSLVQLPVARGIVDYLEACEFPFSGKTAVILGADDTLSKRMLELLLHKSMTVSICTEKSEKSIVSGFLCDADLVVCLQGPRNMVVRTQCLNAIVFDMAGLFEERLDLCTDTAWSISVGDGLNKLGRLALLKNCAYLTNQFEEDKQHD